MAVLYRHIRLDKNEPFYIGIGINEKRAYAKDKRNKYWKNIVSKTDYEVDILFDDLTWENACIKEKEFIQLYGRKDLETGTLVNLTDGGDGAVGYIKTEEHRKKMSESQKGRPRKLHTEETKQKMSKSHKGKPKSEEHRLKMKNRVFTEEHRKKMSEAAKKRYNNTNILIK